MKNFKAIGLMSGTAMDGIDAALIETDGYNYINRIGFESISHNNNLRTALQSQMNKEIYDRDVERDFTLAHIPVIQKLLNNANMTAGDIDVIGLHGQTTHHDPDNGITVQMGDGALLAAEIGIDVVYDFRKNDMMNGGQGAPFLPIYHRALTQNAKLDLPIIVLNLGGVGNITYIDTNDMIAFDTGPANAMIDDWVKSHTGQDYDESGKIAAQGESNAQKIAAFLSLDYFSQPYPKSLDRNDFKNISVDELSLEDGAATLAEMTIQSVAKGVELCPQKPNIVYVTGGGRHNIYMMQQLHAVTGIDVQSVDNLEWNGDAMEAEGFAYMAVRSMLNEPLSFPNTTGCNVPSTGGVYIPNKKKAA